MKRAKQIQIGRYSFVKSEMVTNIRYTKAATKDEYSKAENKDDQHVNSLYFEKASSLHCVSMYSLPQYLQVFKGMPSEEGSNTVVSQILCKRQTAV